MAPERHKPTVLVADDERVIADTLAAVLRNEGFAATAVYSGDAATAAAHEFPPAALVCDIILLTGNGIELAIQIRAMHPACTIILISGAQLSADLLDEARA